MGFGSLRSLIRPIAQGAVARTTLFHIHIPSSSRATHPPNTSLLLPFLNNSSISSSSRDSSICPWTKWHLRSDIHSLTDTRFPKRRPGFTNRRKRASLKPPGPYAWVQYVPGEPIPRSRPNEGSVQGRNRIKRIKLRKAFIKSEAKKRKVQVQEAKRKKITKRIERKMAAVARERAWAERLVELQKLEEEKKAMA
ncbi:Protein translocase subunit SecA [Cinnamomum micranthum f. kanehirae]|uniref:Protein translocase subunit SecA n=1 Tax=Cinnamomum micranthum f. kanehirae TaxID=337451 RepID=A0A443NGA0_9MAGN|nr:Protein translocase subunit SecA [Cinnamomum micranthum f. kanehirae]